MFVEAKIDYLQFSVDRKPPLAYRAQPRESYMRNYKGMYESHLGLDVHYGNVRGREYLCVAKGIACDNLRAVTSIKGFLDLMLSYDAKFSRVDWCVTQFIDGDGLFTTRDFADCAASGLVDSPLMAHGAKTVSDVLELSKIDGFPHVETVYVGDLKKRAKRGIFRCYDKGRELLLGDDMITRRVGS